MKKFSSCKEAMDSCIDHDYFAVAHLYSNEKTMKMHIHDCYEIYYSISGGKQFLIDNAFYDISPGDIFFINVSQSHYLTLVDSQVHERIVLSISPKYLTGISSPHTDLNQCFNGGVTSPHKVSLSSENQQRFMYYIHKLTNTAGLGADLLEQSHFTELMVFLNKQFCENPQVSSPIRESLYHEQVDSILTYINNNLQNPLTINELATNFFLSESYICRIFKTSTGTTINKYISAQRISLAKSLLSQGYSVKESWEMSGFRDYSNFLKSFEAVVGLSPKKYAKFVS